MMYLNRLLMITALVLNADSFATAQTTTQTPPIEISAKALEIHRSGPVIDGHNDLPWALRQSGGASSKIDLKQPQPDLHTDIPRLRRGGVGAQFWSVYVPVSTMGQGSALTTTLEQIALVRSLCDRYSDTFELALGTADIQRIRADGKIASMIGVEGGHSIENSINVLRQLYAEGARYMTLTHSKSLDWADSCTGEAKCGGLSPFGEEVVREMNKLGMLVDISHVSADCMRDALRVSKAPIIFSHSSVYAIANHPRNVPDDVLKLTKKNGGVVMINFYNAYVNPVDAERSKKYYTLRSDLEKQFPEDQERVDSELKRWLVANASSSDCTVHDVINHIDYVAKLVGVDHVGLGSDFDGVPRLPKQVEDVGTYPVITQGLIDRGYSEADIRKVLGGNLMRVFGAAEQVAASLQN
jgi:membrane dipeptidase